MLRDVIQKTRRNKNNMPKKIPNTNGLYKYKNSQIVMLDLNENGLDCTASYTNAQGLVVQQPLAEFIDYCYKI